MYSYYPTRSTN